MSNSYRDHTKYGYNHFIHRALQSENKEVPVLTGVGHYIPDQKPSDNEFKKETYSRLVCSIHQKPTR